MRFARTYVLAFFSLLLAFPVFAQQPSTSTTQSSPQALALLQKSFGALTGGQQITDVTLTGTAQRIVGPDDESGTATLKALASGAASMDLSLSSGHRSETVNLTGPEPAGSWSGPDGASHPIAFHNLLTEPAWFFPAFAISRRLSDSSYTVTYVGPETRNSESVIHISASASQYPASFGDTGPSLQHLSQIDVFLDASSSLPVAITFNIHPDDNARLDIPVEIDFAGYQTVNGAQIPFHVQKSINNSLVLDLQFDSATLNSGLPPATFTVADGL